MKTPPETPVDGTCDSAFAAVEAAFRENFATRDEVGASLCVVADGRKVIDLWGGHLDRERHRPWKKDTLVNAYSVGKGLTAMLALSLVERGELSLDSPITDVWPEFGVSDKAATTLRMLLSHQAGLPGVRANLEPQVMYNWDVMCEALANQAPFWKPGTDHGYHVNTFGYLVGEPICRRLDVNFAEALTTRICGPHNADFHVGLPDDQHARVAPIIEAARAKAEPDAEQDAEGKTPSAFELAKRHFGTGNDQTDMMLASVYFNPSGFSGFGTVNTPEWRRASIPSTNGHGTARGVAKLYDTFMNVDADHGGFVGPGLRTEATATMVEGTDRVLGKPSRFGLGFQLSQPTRRIGAGQAGYGHFGYGGTLGFADPESGIAFGYLMNRPGERWQTPRTNALVEALFASLGQPALANDES